ncbi:MAG: glycosyltransferase [Candidatus Bathyarchaeota archaeon]|nr:glycosyltransferase [Candidatus Bathyarchaeota archaeon]MDH5745737.1 glycosyltransferase [Candidatus Bathyarchaeota archaeon]
MASNHRDNEDNSLVSIIVSTMNEAEHIGDLITSSYAQTYRPLELIIVDGGSVDQTTKIVRKFALALADNLFEIHLLHEETLGNVTSPANARNIGIKNAKGNYIILLDADFFFIDDDSIDKIVTKLRRHQFTKVKVKFAVDTELERQLSLTYGKLHYCAYRKEILRKVTFDPSLGYGEDRDFWFRIYKDIRVNLDVTCDVTLGRHLCHTRKEFVSQTIWYARTLPLFIEKVIRNKENFWYDEICIPLFGSLLAIFVPVFILFSLREDMSCERSLNRIRFGLWNILRRYLFVLTFVRVSIERGFLKSYTLLLLECLKPMLRRHKK